MDVSMPRRAGRMTGGLGRQLAMLCVLGASLLAALPPSALAADAKRRPNIVLILGDDLGYSDIGPFGGEIPTPNLDRLAKEGVRFTNFYTHASCSPTRSIVLTGVDNHVNGLGNMDEYVAPNQRGVPGYEGHLNDRVATLPKLLKDDYYATKTYTDKLIGFIDANRGTGKPFFAYVAHQAPHDPFHLPKEWRGRRIGAYDKGWDAVRSERLARQIDLGIVQPNTALAERM